ncbi:hypothetical protein DYB26_011469 [Aphanomyces astaci]|uniref:Uncharacterized protein n=1 Tax=Aphanomyces astaci TaxID=112090 RepID=A0A3R7BL22_APHAT|nr:hypothetical protein DYB26_011469 [Aphanomyces astaci]
MNFNPILCHNQADPTMPTAAEKLSDIHRAIAYVKRSRGSIVSKPEILDMIMLNAMLRQEGIPAASRRPIEIVWAIVKCQVGRQYTQDTTFRQVLVRLKEAFKDLKASSIKGCIHKADQQLYKLEEYIKQKQDEDASGNVSDSESESDNNSDSDSSSNESSNSESET